MSEPTEKSRAPRRVRNELRFRPVEVLSKTFIAHAFYRIEFGGEALAGFTSPGTDDHIKVFFPDAKTGEFHLPEITEDGVVWKEGVRPVARDYTPLAFDSDNQRLTLDFYRHDAGVASDWATQAKPGDRLAIGGPRGSLVVPDDYAFQLYVCDETGLPALKRRLQTARAEQLHLYIFASETTGSAYLDLPDNADVTWLGSGTMQRENMPDLIGQFERLTLPDEDYFIWLTGEGAAVKQLSDWFIEQQACDPDYVRAVAYWHDKPSS